MKTSFLSWLAAVAPFVVAGRCETSFDKKCAAFASKISLPNTTVWFTQAVTAGTNISLPYNPPDCGAPFTVVRAEVCRISLLQKTSARSNVSYEVWLPSNWTGDRFLSAGNGGLAGCIGYGDLAYATSRGFAAVAGNNGHNGTSGAAFAYDKGVIEDFSWRSVHGGVVLGKQLVADFYGRPHAKNYYLGCSTGGRQGFRMAQDFPGDFDGIVAGAPAFAFNNLTSWSGYFYTVAGKPGSPEFLKMDQWAAVHADIVATCDGLDGAVDGIIEDPDRCFYRPENLICGSPRANPATCLTGRQAETVRKVFSPIYGLSGNLVYPQLQYGADFPSFAGIYLTGQPFVYSAEWFRYVVYHGTNVTFDPALLGPRDYEASEAADFTGISTWKGDLPSELDKFYRYFRVSGLAHCNGGTGAGVIGTGAGSSLDPDENVLSAVVRWVEQGVAPDTITGSAIVNGKVDYKRRHCRYPLRNVFKGGAGGDFKNPDNWSCEL
ncbi:feruloyl esterase B [Magnaporthiopsis poae ATCC 64411]|uniref:Carboxylic ester hydrolase n=1 Tax=Magnaporthiopsis poae (strain ATCC 64411 / 73-15) TaxID=644358 RepID=A0A0C4DU50_MAGP6|nr:feruloyl esterase B [Magnaporthiopsis poae ATCC 64411]